MDEIGLVGRMSDMKFMIHVLNSLPEEYDVVLDSLETHLVSTKEDTLMCEALQDKFQGLKEFSLKKERRNSMRKHWLQDSMCSSRDHTTSVVNMATIRLTKVSGE